MSLAGLQTSWGLVGTHLVSLGCVLLAFALTIVGINVRKPKMVVFVRRFSLADTSRRGAETYLGAVNGIGRQRAQWRA